MEQGKDVNDLAEMVFDIMTEEYKEKVDANKDLKAIAKRLGHSNIRTTYEIYVRVTKKMKTDTVDKFEDFANELELCS